LISKSSSVKNLSIVASAQERATGISQVDTAVNIRCAPARIEALPGAEAKHLAADAHAAPTLERETAMVGTRAFFQLIAPPAPRVRCGMV
jgi:hypothetical protein